MIEFRNMANKADEAAINAVSKILENLDESRGEKTYDEWQQSIGEKRAYELCSEILWGVITEIGYEK